MLELLKKTMLTGIGLALKTRDEVEDLARDWASTQKMSEEEGRKFLEDLMKRYDTSMDKLEEQVENTVKTVLRKTAVVTKDEFDALKQEVTLIRETLRAKKEGE
jgi:polyhydroxyalkanoate synthesis regulator phasin